MIVMEWDENGAWDSVSVADCEYAKQASNREVGARSRLGKGCGMENSASFLRRFNLAPSTPHLSSCFTRTWCGIYAFPLSSCRWSTKPARLE